MVGDTLFNIFHAAVAEFDRVFFFLILWSLLFAGKQALSNVKKFLPMLVATFLLNWGGGGGVKPSDLLSSLFVVVFFCIICEGLIFFGSLSLGVFLFCSGWFLCWCI